MSTTSIETRPARANLGINFLIAAAISFVSNVTCHLVLGRIFGLYTEPCFGIESDKAANNLLGYSIIVAFQIPALAYWLTREKSRLAIPIAIVANAVIGLIWVWWTTPIC